MEGARVSLANSQQRIDWLKTPKSPRRVNERAGQNVQSFSYPTAAIRNLRADSGPLRRSWFSQIASLIYNAIWSRPW